MSDSTSPRPISVTPSTSSSLRNAPLGHQWRSRERWDKNSVSHLETRPDYHVSAHNHPTGDLDSDMPYAKSGPLSSRPRTAQKKERLSEVTTSSASEIVQDSEGSGVVELAMARETVEVKSRRKSACGNWRGSGRVYPQLENAEGITSPDQSLIAFNGLAGECEKMMVTQETTKSVESRNRTRRF